MVAIVAGHGLGLHNTSLHTVGAVGVLGESLFGQAGSGAVVNVANGNLVLQSPDGRLSGRGTDLFALRTHNSLGAPTDGDGDGWRWGYEQAVRYQGPGAPHQPGLGATAIRAEGDGHETVYTWEAAQASFLATAGSGAHDQLRYDDVASEWVWTDGSTRVSERYSDSTDPDTIGRLIRRTDPSGNGITLGYVGGRLTSIEDAASQQALRLTYGQIGGLTRLQGLEARPLTDDANGHATATLGDPQRLADYDYDSQGRLITVTRHLTATGGGAAGDGFVTTYGYGDSSSRIATVTQSDGTSLSFGYDAAGRVREVRDHASAAAAHLAFVYGADLNSTAITDGNGQVWTYRHDAATGQVIEIRTPPVAGAGLSTTFGYDGAGNLLAITDPQSNAVTYGYDTGGSPALERDAVGNTTTRTFSPLHQMLTETRYRLPDPDGVGPQPAADPVTTRYVYDANARLRFEVSGEGRVSENRYGGPTAGFGLLTETLLYVGQLFDVTGLGPAQHLTEADLEAWVAALPDRTQVQLTGYRYDLRGNMSHETSFATVAVTGAGVLDERATAAEYAFDPHGGLRQHSVVRGTDRDQRSVVRSFAHDGMLRVLQTSGANGPQSTAYDDAHRRVIVTSSGGLVETRDHDSRGRVVSISQTGDGQTRRTRYVHDNADRLRMVEDAQGGRRYRFYDAAGRLEFTVDATGAVTRSGHDAAGRLVRQTSYRNRADTAGWYDDAAGTVTKATLAVGGTDGDVALDPTHDRESIFAYDAAGRQTASTDAEGTVTAISYDGLSRVVMTQTGDRITRYLYDKDDRRVGIVDALGFFTESRYDAGGRPAESIRYAERSPSSTVPPADRVEPSDWRPADTSGLRSYLYHDGQGRVVGAVDEHQFLTETVYNDAVNTQQMLRYPVPVVVAAADTLASLRSRAGAGRQVSLVRYDDFGRVRTVTGLDGSTVTRHEYDDAGRLTRVVNAADTDAERGRRTFYNAFGEIRATLGGEGDRWLGSDPTPQRIDQAVRDFGMRREYDTLGHLVRSIDASGNRTLCYYDHEGWPTHTVNVIGQAADHSLAGEVAETTYNSFGQPESVRRFAARLADPDMDLLLGDGGGGVADQSLVSRLAALTDDDLDHVVRYGYDRCGRVVKQLDGENGGTENSYNVHGQLATQTVTIRPGQTTTTQFHYDLNGRPVSQIDDAGGINAVTATEYDAFGRVTRAIDAAGQATTTSYPDSGRSIVVTDPLQRTTSTAYDTLGRVFRLTDALGHQTTHAYDDAARGVTITTPQGRTVATMRNRHGEIARVTDGRGGVVRHEFNADGQPTSTTDAMGNATARTTYDSTGRAVDVTDARGTVTHLAYDQRNRIAERRVDPDGLNLTTRFAFDALGQQIRATDAAGSPAARVTTYTYDRKGRTTRIVIDATADGPAPCTTYGYDGLDNVVSVARGTVSSPAQHVMVYEFDQRGRRVAETAAPSSVFGPGTPDTRDLTTRYRYDTSGRLTRRIDPNGRSTWTVHDVAGQQTHTIGAQGEVGESRYDAAGRLICRHDYLDRLAPGAIADFGDVVTSLPAAPAAMPNDRRSLVAYDRDGRARFTLKAAGADGWIVEENRHDGNANLVEVRSYPRYLPADRVAALESAAPAGITPEDVEQELVSLGYHEDDPDTLTGVPRTLIAYDADNRERFIVDPTGSVTERGYDAAGNTILETRFAARPALTEFSESAIDAAVDRDDPDNRVTRYAHDAANRLRYAVDTLGSVTENEFDARGNPVTTVRRATRPVLTHHTEAAIAEALAATPAAIDEVTRRVYDVADRVRFTIDATDSMTENIHDAVGSLVATTRFAQRSNLIGTATLTEAAVAAAVEPLRVDLDNQASRFAYDAEQRLRFAVDPLGSVIENEYDADHHLLATTRFAARPALTQVDEATIAAALDPLRGDPANRTTRFAYDTAGRLRYTVDALGSVSERTYDALGNLTATARFAERPPLTAYSTGALELAVAPHRGDPGNRLEHQLHDALGRVRFAVSKVSVAAGQSRYRVSRHEWNALGRMVASTSYATPVVLPDLSESGITTAIGDGEPERDNDSRFVHDLAGRVVYGLRAVTAETGRRRYRVGAVRFDAFGQSVGTTDYATTVALDTFAQPSVAAAVQVVAEPARDRAATVAYDPLGQVVYRVQALGAAANQVIGQQHDALGRVIRTRQYADPVGPLGGSDRAAIEAAVTGAASPNDRRSHYVHDAAGRQRFVLQADKPEHWTVGENRHDAFGNLVESRRCHRYLTDQWIATVDAARPMGATEQDVIDQLVALGYDDAVPGTLAENQRSRFAYDTRNRVRFTIDTLGSVAENVYNALGDLAATAQFAIRPVPPQYTERAIDSVVDRSDPGNRVQHFAYDALAQLRFTVRVAEPNVGSAGRHSIEERRYDALGHLVQTRAYAITTGHLDAYDELTLAASIVADPANDRVSAVAFDAGGRQRFAVRQLTASDRYLVTSHVHDALDGLVQRIDHASPTTLAQFDEASIDSAVAWQPGNDRTTTYVRDAAGRVRFEIQPDLAFQENEHDALDQPIEIRRFDVRLPDSTPRTEPEMVALRGTRAVGDGVTRGRVQTWDAGGRLTGIVDALGNVERYEYDPLGSRTRWTDKNGNTFTCVYDRAGRKISETTPPTPFTLHGETLGTPTPDREVETRFGYDAFGNLIRKIEAANFGDAATTDYAYDTVGRPTGTFDHGFYDPATGTVETAPGDGRFRREASISYDALGNAVRIANRRGANAFQHTWRTHNTLGQVAHELNALDHVTRYTFNAFGERETVTRYSVTIPGTPGNGEYWTAGEIEPKLNYGFDEVGNLVEDYLARTIRLAYDKLGRKTVVTQPMATFYSTQLPGDPAQANYFRLNPTSVTGSQDAAETRYEYNAFGDLTLQRIRANTIVEWQDTAFSHDAAGRRIRSVDAAGNVTSMSYDTAGNVVRHAEPTKQPIGLDRITDFTYNLLDQQTRVDRYGLRYTDANGVEHGVVTWTWENGGEYLDPDADVATTVRAASYDPYGRPLAVTDAVGNITTLRYDTLGRLAEVVTPARLIAPVAANGADPVDPFRNQPSETLITSMTVDVFGRAVRAVRATSQGGDGRETVQSYDVGGNLVSTADPEGNVTRRAHDFAGRVIREATAISADLGPLGLNTQGLERRYAYDALGQLTHTLDVYLDDGDPVQSGRSAVYNPFGEVVQERRMWGPADRPPEALSTALVTRYDYDNAGRVFDKVAADGLTLYFYNLLGQLTREEKRGGAIWPNDSPDRVTETQYDVLGRATMIRRPPFEADVTAGTGTTLRLVTPYSSRTLDRWGNVTGSQEGGYEFVNGQPSFARNGVGRGYGYDDNNRIVRESLGTHGFVTETGVADIVLISKVISRDLLGNVVKEVDEAREPQTEELISSRTRRKEYDSVGNPTAEIDATDRKLEYAYNIHAERLGTRNARGAVSFDRRDRNGNVRFHGVLRTTGPGGPGEYDSHVGTGTLVRTYLNAYLYDQAGRRFAGKTFTEGADAPWSYTWLDGRNLGVRQRDVMGGITRYRFDPFGNKAVEIDPAGVRVGEWNAATEDFVVGRIDTYRLPSDGVERLGRYVYNDFSEVKFNAYGNTRTEYDRHENGLVAVTTIMRDVTQPSAVEVTRYAYDACGRLTMEGRFGPDSLQTKMISYDNEGRLSQVEDQRVPNLPTCDVRYAYDEWGNVRRIQATYIPTAAEGEHGRLSWYTYDDAGRMTVSDGALTGGNIGPKLRTTGSVRIHYDPVGRREGATEFVRRNTAAPHGGPLRTWDTMRDERYEYDDLGHLRRIEQRYRHVNIVTSDPIDDAGPRSRRGQPFRMTDADRIGAWRPQSNHTTNLRGDVTRSEQWARISGFPNNLSVDQVPAHQGTTTTAYRPDCQVSWTKTDAADPNKSTETRNTYHAQTGQLDSYAFSAFRTDGVPFTATFEYRYTFQHGQPAIRRISDRRLGLDTTKTYDLLGRLTFERVDLQKPNGDGSDRFEERRYEHGAERRVIFKDSRLRLSASGPDTQPLPQPTMGQQTYVFAGERMVGTVGANRLSRATAFTFAYTPMTEAAGSGSSRYVVQSSDSLIDIAQATYGDGTLWYVIAEANSVPGEPGDPLPSSEIGKAYEIPDTVRGTHSASTIDSYGMSQIIGNDRPIAIPPPPPPKVSDIERIAVAAVSITVQVGATVVLSAVGVPAPVSYAIGAGLSNLAGQATSWALGIQAPGHEGIDWGDVGIAAMEGYLFSVAGPAAALSREVLQQAKGGFEGWTGGPGLNWSGIAGSLFNVGVDALAPLLGGPRLGPVNLGMAGLLNSAYNPSSGWAVPGSGRGPTVGAFEYAFSAVANGLASVGYAWIRDQLERPSTPAAPAGPRSVDALGPMSAEQIDLWDELDRQYTQELDHAGLLARNRQIAAAGDESLHWQLRLAASQDLVDHLGDSIDDRAVIGAVLRQQNAERAWREQVAALRRARAAASAATRRANSARIEALMAKGPDPSLVQYARDMEENDRQIVQEMYAGGTFVRLSKSVSYDGLTVELGSGVYDTQGLYPGSRNSLLMDELVRDYREYQRSDPSLTGGLEVIVVNDKNTSAAQARRLGLSEVQTFSQFAKSYARDKRSSQGVEKAFIKYHVQRSQEIDANYDHIDHAAGAVNKILGGLTLGVSFAIAPTATIGSLIANFGTEKALRFAGVDEETAAMLGGVAGVIAGGVISYRQMVANPRPGGSVKSILQAERAARADAAWLAARAAEYELSKGIPLGGGTTLFKAGSPVARAAQLLKTANSTSAPALALAPPVSPLALAPSASSLALAGLVATGGVPAVPGVHYYPAGASIGAAVSYEASAARQMSDALRIGGGEPRSGLVANISAGDDGFTGGEFEIRTYARGAGSAGWGRPRPAIVYDSDRSRLITVHNGQAVYRSSGDSPSYLGGSTVPTFKTAGAYYPFRGVQEHRATSKWLDQPVHRGWLIKKSQDFDPVTRQPFDIDYAPVSGLSSATFQIQGHFREPEDVNRWLGDQGYVPFIDIREFFGE